MSNKPPLSLTRRARDQAGTTAVEMALLLFAVLAITVGVFDVGLATWNWFTTQKATQRAVRFAVESDAVASKFREFRAVTTLGVQAPTPLDLNLVPAFTVRCLSDGSTVSCSCLTGGSTCTVGGGGGFDFADQVDPGAFTDILNHMQRMQPRIQSENLVVDYTNVGLGFAGRPELELIPQVAISLRNMSYEFFALDAFIPINGIIPMGSFDSTMTAEDLETCGLPDPDNQETCL